MKNYCEQSHLIAAKLLLLMRNMAKGIKVEKIEIKNIISSINYENCGKCYPCKNVEVLISRLTDYVNNKLSIENIKFFVANSFDLAFYDEINSIFDNVTDLPSDFELVDLNENKKTVYFDQNIYSDCIKFDGFLKDIMGSKDSFYYIYSPENIEELYKIDSENKRDQFIELIKKVTDSIILLPNIEKYRYAKEDPIYSLERIKLFDGSTQLMEEHKLMTSDDRSIFKPEYDTSSHKKSIGNKQNILRNLDKNEFSDLMNICGSPFNRIEDFENLVSKLDLVEAVRALYDCLDLLSYRIDNTERTIKSGVHDIEHLVYATHMDYFVSKDKNLRHRAREIFNVLNINVIILSKENFLDLLDT